jgi:ferrochelatase
MTRARDDVRVGVLVMSHGTPTSMRDLERFYTEIRRGRPPEPELLADLERRYLAIGGTSPLAERTAAQVAGISRALDGLRPGRFFVVAGTKYGSPLIEEAVEQLRDEGTRRAIGVVLAPHSSSVSVGEYARRAVEAAAAAPKADGVKADRLPIDMEVVDHWHTEDGLVELLAERTLDRVRAVVDRGVPADAIEVLFSAHSIPTRAVEEGDTYDAQVEETAQQVATRAGIHNWQVAWQSAGLSGGRWLGPGLLEVIASLSESNVRAVVVCPVGFVSDHLEILFDLDVEAASLARSRGFEFERTASLNDDPRFCDVVARVVVHADEASKSRAKT